MTKIVLHLPFPPSVNELWRSNRGRVHISAVYKTWKAAAGWEWLIQKGGYSNTSLPGAFTAHLTLSSLHRTKRKDSDNRMKAPLDFCKAHGLIKDDSLCEQGMFRWGTPQEAPLGARLILRKFR